MYIRTPIQDFLLDEKLILDKCVMNNQFEIFNGIHPLEKDVELYFLVVEI